MFQKQNKIFIGTVIISLLMVALPPMISESLSAANYIVMLFGALLSALLVVTTAFVRYKEQKAKRILTEAVSRDKIWDFGEMKILARAMFYRLHRVWENGGPDSIREYSSTRFITFFESEVMHKPHPAGNSGQMFDIEETRIICCQDYLKNDKDKFVAYIHGKVTSGKTNPEFSVILYFIREQNEWLLDKTDYGIGIWDLLTTRNVDETK